MKKQNLLNILLAAVVGIAMLVLMLCRTFQPAVVLPPLNIPNILILSALALALDAYLAPGVKRCWIGVWLLASLTFGLLPWAAGQADAHVVWKLALVGGVVFTLAAWLFDSMSQRLRSGPVGKLAPVVTALGLALAGQCFAGMIL